MIKIKKPDLTSAICKVKGYHASIITGFGATGMLLSSIAILIIAVEARKVVSDTFMVCSWAVYIVLMLLSVAALAGGIILTISIKKKYCVSFFKDSIIVYEFKSLANCGYRSFEYDEIAEYGFIHKLDKDVKNDIYLYCEVFNYGKLKILDTAGKMHTVPVGDINITKEFLKEYTGKEEKIYQMLKGIHY